MKKAIKLLCGIMCLFMVMTVLLTGCDFGNVDVAHGKDQTPVYYGMLLFDSSDVKIPEVNYVDETSNSSDNQYGWYKDNDGLIRSIHDKHEPLYVSQNQDVYAYVGISNPSEFQIVSFVINGQTFTSDMFDARSTNEVKIVKLNVGNARGIVEYTVSDIKYADGKEIKNVYMLGDPVAKASVKAENQITATVNKIELKDSGKEIFFDITITDEYGLIASGKGNVKLLVYRDGKVQKEAELTGGENKITIQTLNKNKEHEYEIVAYYDDFSGQGTSDHTLVSKYPLQKDHSHTFGDWETTKAPTCGKDGEKARICSGCGTGETEKLSATGLHSFDNNCDATCNGCEFTRTVGDHVYDNACDWNCNVCGYPRAVGDHVYDDQYDDTCNECGFVRDADCKHVYDNDCDTICNVCGATRTAGGHSYASTVTPPTATENGAITYICSNCGNTYSETIVPQNFTVTADNRAMVGYTGAENENLVIPAVFEDSGTWYRVTSIDYWAFDWCSNLTSVTIPDSVTAIGTSAFERCSNLTSITIPDSVTTIGDWAFGDCDNLTSVTIGDSVTTIGDSAFMGCSKITSVTIPDSVTTIGFEAFRDCDNLANVTIGDSVTTIGDRAFEWCTNLTSITIPDSVTAIGDSAFYGCDFKSVTIPAAVTSIGEEAFYECRQLASIVVDDNNIAYKSIDGNLYSKDGTALIAYAIGKFETSFIIPDGVTIIGNYAFAGCRLDNITIPNSVTTIGDSAFQYCALTSVTIPDSVTTIGDWAFAATPLTSITIPNSVITIGDKAFLAANLTSIVIGNGVTTIGKSVFYSCDYLTRIVVDEANTTYQSIDGNLYSKDGTILIAYAIGKNDTSFTIPSSVTIIGDDAFLSCDYLESVTIPDSTTTIGNYAFLSCTNLKSVAIGKSVAFIGYLAFNDCDNFTSVTFTKPNGWWCAKNQNATSGTVISTTVLSNPATAAQYLKSDYTWYYWYRTE